MYKEKQLIIPLYKTIVRPHLEYCIQAWRPYRKKDIDKLDCYVEDIENLLSVINIKNVQLFRRNLLCHPKCH